MYLLAKTVDTHKEKFLERKNTDALSYIQQRRSNFPISAGQMRKVETPNAFAWDNSESSDEDDSSLE